MSTLIVQIPPRHRFSARSREPVALRPSAEYNYAISADGRTAGLHGRCAPELLPKARDTVLLVDDGDVSWHRLDIPKAPANRMRDALVGVLEESLLEDDADVHIALAPGTKPGTPGWVAIVSRPWLATHLQAIEAAGVYVDRVAPGMVPGAARAHAAPLLDAQSSVPTDFLRLSVSNDAGVLCLPLTAAAAALPAQDADSALLQWTASPAAAETAERIAGHPVQVVSDADRLVVAAQGVWNLRQFGLAPRQRGTRALRSGWGKFLGPDWAPVRYGALALVAVQLLGLNIWAWEQRRAIDQQRAAVTQVLRDTFPQVRSIQNAPIQMTKEVDILRSAAGRPGDTDLEPLLYAAESAWPATRGPAESLKFEPGKLSVSAAGWTPQEIERFSMQLKAAGIAVEVKAGRLTLSRIAVGDPAAGKRS